MTRKRNVYNKVAYPFHDGGRHERVIEKFLTKKLKHNFRNGLVIIFTAQAEEIGVLVRRFL